MPENKEAPHATSFTPGSAPETPPRQQYFRIISDGLAPVFQPGDHVLVEYGHPVKSGDYALASFGDTTGLLQVFYEEDGSIRLVGRESVTPPDPDVDILGRVMERVRPIPSASDDKEDLEKLRRLVRKSLGQEGR